jgi:hypothetical protein
MKNVKELEHLVSKRWPKLKQSAQNENDPEKLIEILEEIDDLLFNLEMRITAQGGKMRSNAGNDARSNSQKFSGDSPPLDSEVGIE